MGVQIPVLPNLSLSGCGCRNWTHRRDESWSGSLCQTFFSRSVGSQIPVLVELSLLVCGCRNWVRSGLIVEMRPGLVVSDKPFFPRLWDPTSRSLWESRWESRSLSFRNCHSRFVVVGTGSDQVSSCSSSAFYWNSKDKIVVLHTSP